MSAVHTISVAGTDVHFSCEAGDTLLRAGLRAGLGLSYECNAGSCGTCKLELVEGSAVDLYPGASGIRQRDRERGRRLACQSEPTSDCVISTRFDDNYVPRHRPQRIAAVLESVRDITHDIREFSFRSDRPALFRAGQFAMLTLPSAGVPRAYSMSNAGNVDGLWQFMVRLNPPGVVTPALFELGLGSVVSLDGPFGIAYLREECERPIVCVAGGSGIAPMSSILRAAAELRHTPRLEAWLFYGGRGPADVPAIDAVLGYDHLDRGLQWHPAVSVAALDDGMDWHGECGLVHELLPRKLPRPLTEYEYYLAGPPPMVEAAVRLLVADNKVPPTQLHFDRFY